MAMGYKQTAKPEQTPPKPLFKPLSKMTYDEFDDDVAITYQGTKSSVPSGANAGLTNAEQDATLSFPSFLTLERYARIDLGTIIDLTWKAIARSGPRTSLP